MFFKSNHKIGTVTASRLFSLNIVQSAKITFYVYVSSLPTRVQGTLVIECFKLGPDPESVSFR